MWLDSLVALPAARSVETVPAPVPLSATEAEAPPVIDRVPVRGPDAVGVNVTATVQEAPAAREEPQVVVRA